MNSPLLVNGKEIGNVEVWRKGDCGDGSEINTVTFVDGSELSFAEYLEFESKYARRILGGDLADRF